MDRLADFMHGDIVRISSYRLSEMEQIAASNEKKRYRICLHDSPENRQHEMIICMSREDYGRPHKHVGMSETHVILKGRERVVLFNEEGRVIDSFVLDRDGGDLCYRINAGIYHMSIPITEMVIELEAKGGPFVPSSNIYPAWAPDGSDAGEAKKYVEEVLNEVSCDRGIGVYRQGDR